MHFIFFFPLFLSMYYNYIFYLQLDICHNVLQGSDYVGGISIRVYIFFFFCVCGGVLLATKGQVPIILYSFLPK